MPYAPVRGLISEIIARISGDGAGLRMVLSSIPVVDAMDAGTRSREGEEVGQLLDGLLSNIRHVNGALFLVEEKRTDREAMSQEFPPWETAPARNTLRVGAGKSSSVCEVVEIKCLAVVANAVRAVFFMPSFNQDTVAMCGSF